MDLFSLLKQDHAEMIRLLNRMILQPDPKRENIKELQTTLSDLLINHTHMEEEFLYSKVSAFSKDMVTEFYSAHERADKTLDEICRHHFETEPWTTACEKLLSELQQHFSQEEDQLLPELQRHLSPQECQQIYDAMMNFRQHHLIIQ